MFEVPVLSLIVLLVQTALLSAMQLEVFVPWGGKKRDGLSALAPLN